MKYTAKEVQSIEINRASFTIQTKYFRPTNFRGSRIKVWLPSRDGYSMTVCFHASSCDPHDHAASEWFLKFGNKFPEITGSPFTNKTVKIKLLKLATPTGFMYTVESLVN